MKITDIPEIEINPIYNNKDGGQKDKIQEVNTPFGKLTISCNIEIPKLSASKRTWKVWYKRFIETPKEFKKYVKNQQIQLNLKRRHDKRILGYSS